MDFEWDENKNLKNIAKHGVDFNQAKEVFNDKKRTTSPDLRANYEKIAGKPWVPFWELFFL